MSRLNLGSSWYPVNIYVIGHHLSFNYHGMKNNTSCNLPRMKERFRIRANVLIMIIKDNSVLLMRRKNTGFGDGCWGLPGGGLDGKEPLRSACCRELKEELGITVSPEEVSFTSLLHLAPYFRTPDETMQICFKVEEFQGTIKNEEPERCSDIRFFPLKEPPSDILEGSLRCVENYLEGSHFSELHW
jgi:8-oxo-dGTP diphosphatase